MISCDEAAILCCKTQYKEASLIEKIKLKFHLFFCKACSGFSDKNTKLTSICEESNLKSLSEKDKSELKKCLEAEKVKSS